MRKQKTQKEQKVHWCKTPMCSTVCAAISVRAHNLSIPLTIHALIRVLLIFIKIRNVEVRRYLQICLVSFNPFAKHCRFD